MTRDNAKKILMEQLDKIPTWECCTKMTADEIRNNVATQLQFEEVRDYLKVPGNALKLSMKEITLKLFEVILFFVLDRENSNNYYFFGNDVIFDVQAQNKVLEIMNGWNVYNIQSLTLESFLNFAKETMA